MAEVHRLSKEARSRAEEALYSAAAATESWTKVRVISLLVATLKTELFFVSQNRLRENPLEVAGNIFEASCCSE